MRGSQKTKKLSKMLFFFLPRLNIVVYLCHLEVCLLHEACNFLDSQPWVLVVALRGSIICLRRHGIQSWCPEPRNGLVTALEEWKFEDWIRFDTNPLFAIVNEGAASRWSAEKIRNEFQDVFDAVKAAKEGRPVYFTRGVPVAAAVYVEDLYVNFHISQATAAQISGIRLWMTNEYRHSGLRDSGSKVYEYLMGLLNGNKPIF